VNIISYNLINHYNKAINHYISVLNSLNTIKAYKEISLDPTKINLGFTYYTKWFIIDPNLDYYNYPLRCAVVALKNLDSIDAGTSRVLTFKKSTIAPALDNLKTSIDRALGLIRGLNI
jgi:chitinase